MSGGRIAVCGVARQHAGKDLVLAQVVERSATAERAPGEAEKLNQGIQGQPANQTPEARTAPWPEIGSMEDEREGNMPSSSQTEGKDNPLPGKSHGTP